MFRIQKKLSYNCLESYKLLNNSKPILGRMGFNPDGIKRKINSIGLGNQKDETIEKRSI